MQKYSLNDLLTLIKFASSQKDNLIYIYNPTETTIPILEFFNVVFDKYKNIENNYTIRIDTFEQPNTKIYNSMSEFINNQFYGIPSMKAKEENNILLFDEHLTYSKSYKQKTNYLFENVFYLNPLIETLTKYVAYHYDKLSHLMIFFSKEKGNVAKVNINISEEIFNEINNLSIKDINNKIIEDLKYKLNGLNSAIVTYFNSPNQKENNFIELLNILKKQYSLNTKKYN